ncbi:MAG TPA: VOC family protein [Anaerolineales bacterium]|nr:VOC family protein [Anaerolineales bacterium]
MDHEGHETGERHARGRVVGRYAELRKYFEQLASGGMVAMPLEKAPWGDTFGMLTDQFGINWMVNIVGQAG